MACTASATLSRSPGPPRIPSSTRSGLTIPEDQPTCKSPGKQSAWPRRDTRSRSAACTPPLTGGGTRYRSQQTSSCAPSPPPPACVTSCARTRCPPRVTTGAASAAHSATTASPRSPAPPATRPTCSLPGRWGTGVTELLNTLYVQTPGTSLHLEGDTVRIFHPERPGRKILPLARIDHVVLFGGVTITDDLLLRCADDRRTVSWLTGLGRFRARLCGQTAGNPLLRRAQHRAHEDQACRLAIAQRMIAGKLHNSRQVLLRAARDAAGAKQTALRAAADRHAELLPRAGQSADVEALLGIEGTAARVYFAA